MIIFKQIDNMLFYNLENKLYYDETRSFRKNIGNNLREVLTKRLLTYITTEGIIHHWVIAHDFIQTN